MKTYWNSTNIFIFAVGLFLGIGGLTKAIRGHGSGMLYHSIGLEARLHGGLILLIALYMMSRVFFVKKDRDLTLLEGVSLFSLALLCEIIPHNIMHFIK